VGLNPLFTHSIWLKFSRNYKQGKNMTELLFMAGCILIFQYSFLNKYMAILAAAITIGLASSMEVNMYIVLGTILILSIIRMTKSSVKDEF